MCGNEKIRFVHIMEHPQYPYEMYVGCNCAESMTEDYVNPKARELTMKNRASRRQNFLNQKWYRNSKGNYVLRYKGDYITVMPSKYEKGFGIYFNNKSVWEYKGQKILDLDTAKLAAFGAFDEV